MHTKVLIACLYFLLAVPTLHAAQTTIIEAEGYACMGADFSRKQAEQVAIADSKRNAAEAALTHIRSETVVQNSELQDDLITAYSKAQVKLLEVLDKSWYKDISAGDCFKIKIKAEVLPDMTAISSGKGSKQTKEAKLDTEWHSYKNRRLDIFGQREKTSKVSTPTDKWKIIGPINVNTNDEYEWGWELTLKINKDDKALDGWVSLMNVADIKYMLLDKDGFVIATDTLDISHENPVVSSLILQKLNNDKSDPEMVQEYGSTFTYRQTAKISKAKALRARTGKYQIEVK